MGHGQYDGLGEYCGPHTACSVFLILVATQYILAYTSETVSLNLSLGCCRSGLAMTNTSPNLPQPHLLRLVRVWCGKEQLSGGNQGRGGGGEKSGESQPKKSHSSETQTSLQNYTQEVV